MDSNRQTHTIDATDQTIGRLATRVALILRGKNKATFRPHEDGGDFIIIKNASKARLSGKKSSQKLYLRHTGYLGGLKAKSAGEMLLQNPGEVLRRAVLGMLPATRLKKEQIKRLKIEE